MKWIISILAVVVDTAVTCLIGHWLTLKDGESFWSWTGNDTFMLFWIAAGAIWFNFFKPRKPFTQALEPGEAGYDKRQGPKWKWIAIVCSLLLGALGIWSLTAPAEEVSLKMKVCGVLLLALAIACLASMLWQLFGPRRAPRYDCDQTYLYLLYPLRHEQVEWRHITGFSLRYSEMLDQTVVVVHVDNTEELLASMSRVKRRLYEQTVEEFGSIYSIYTANCVLQPEQIMEQLQAELQRHKARQFDNLTI